MFVPLISEGKKHPGLPAGNCPSCCGLAGMCSSPTSLVALGVMQDDNYNFSTPFESLFKGYFVNFYIFNIALYKLILCITAR